MKNAEKMDYAIYALCRALGDTNKRSEADRAISGYTRMLKNGIESLNKYEIDEMVAELAQHWWDDEETI